MNFAALDVNADEASSTDGEIHPAGKNMRCYLAEHFSVEVARMGAYSYYDKVTTSGRAPAHGSCLNHKASRSAHGIIGTAPRSGPRR